MAENGAGSGTPAEPQSQQTTPPAGSSGTTATAAPGTPAEPAGIPSSENMSLDEAKKLRAESSSLRKRLAELEAAQQAAENAKLSETEKLQKQHAQLQEQNASLLIELQSARLIQEIARHAPALNLIDPDAARLMLQAGGELDADERGNYTNVAKLLEKLIAEKPYLVASNVMRPPAPPSSGGATNPGRSVLPTGTPAPTDPKAAYQAHKRGGGLANPALWKRS